MSEAVTRRRPPGKADRDAFLKALAEGWTVTAAASRTRHHRRRFYEIRERDEAFALAWDEALEQGTDRLEDEAMRRAVEGWSEPLIVKGEVVGTTTKYSDRLLELLLKSRVPHRYRDNARVEVTGRDGQPLQVESSREPATLGDLVLLAGRLGVLERLGYRRDGEVVDGEAVEVKLELPEGRS